MKNLLGLLMCVGFFSASTAFAATCANGTSSRVMTVLSEPGCPSGLVLLDIETVCVAKTSPAILSLKNQKKYELCLSETQWVSGGWAVNVESAVEKN